MLSMVGVFISWVVQSIVNMVGVPTRLVANTVPSDFYLLRSRTVDYAYVIKASGVIRNRSH